LLGYGYNHGQPVHECSPDLLLHSLADLPNHLS